MHQKRYNGDQLKRDEIILNDIIDEKFKNYKDGSEEMYFIFF